MHFHNENAASIDLAVGVYTDDIVWEVPARGLVHRDRETVKQEYRRRADDELRVQDDIPDGAPSEVFG